MRILACGLGLILCCLLGTQQARALVRIDIDLQQQRMSVTSASGAEYSWPVSSGRVGHLTPRGVFRPQRLMLIAYSIKYEMAPMPHAIFFSGGYAIHGTNAVGQLGRPASHGCVRLAPGNAATLYALVQHEGARISIFGAVPGSAHRAANRWQAAHAHLVEHWLQPRQIPAVDERALEIWQLRPWPGD
jgi:hypothetical protein